MNNQTVRKTNMESVRVSARTRACVIVFGVLLSVTIAGVSYLKKHLDMEQNPRAIMHGALVTEFGRAPVVRVADNPKMLIVKVTSLGPFRTGDALERYLAKSGWTPEDRQGSVYYFNNPGRPKLVVRIRPFTSRYRVCELNQAP